MIVGGALLLYCTVLVLAPILVTVFALHASNTTPFSLFQTCILSLLCCLVFSATLYALIVIPPGGFHFNINGLFVCEPYFISNNILALAACLFYFPTTMILMYCYGTIFHSVKVKARYKKAILTSLPFVKGENGQKVAQKVTDFFLAHV